MRIAFSGKSGSGKSFACTHLYSKHAGIHAAFADELVRALRYLHDKLGLGYEKDRDLLQAVGTWGRRRDPHVFTRPIVDLVSRHPDSNLFVSHLRHRNEADVLRGLDFVLVRIDGEVKDRAPWRQHSSECELDDYDNFDFRIFNCKKPGHLEQCLEVMVSAIKEGRHKWEPRRTVTIR